jgi:hypothetical protein
MAVRARAVAEAEFDGHFQIERTLAVYAEARGRPPEAGA